MAGRSLSGSKRRHQEHESNMSWRGQGKRMSVASVADSMVSVDDEDVEKNLLKVRI